VIRAVLAWLSALDRVPGKLVDRFHANYEKKSGRKKGDPIREPRWQIWIGISSTLFFIGCMVVMWMFPNETATGWVWLGFSFFVVWSLAMTIGYSAVEIRLNEDHLTYRTPFLRTHKILYNSIRTYTVVHTKIYFYAEGKRYAMSRRMEGVDELYETIRAHQKKGG